MSIKWSRFGSRPLLGVNADLFLTIDSSLLVSPAKNSRNRSFRPKFCVSVSKSSLFDLGVGVNFNPRFSNFSSFIFNSLFDRLIIFGSIVVFSVWFRPSSAGPVRDWAGPGLKNELGVRLVFPCVSLYFLKFGFLNFFYIHCCCSSGYPIFLVDC